MPEISRFYNIIVRMYYNDTVKHNRPHIHVFYGDYEATIGIDGELLAGSLPVRQMKMVLAWVVIHEEELYREWNKAVVGKPVSRISPLT